MASTAQRSALGRYAVRSAQQHYGETRNSFLRQTRTTTSDASISCVRQCVGAGSGRRGLSTFAAAAGHRRPLLLAPVGLSSKDTKARSENAFRSGRTPFVALESSRTRRTMATHADSSTQQVRRDSAMSNVEEAYEAVVVGAGPAGITAVGNLLEQGLQKILWVDEYFNGGRVNQYYREVPSNTKVKLFIDYAQALSPFREIVGGAQAQDGSTTATTKASNEDKLHVLRKLDQEKGCNLGHAADMCLILTEGLKQHPSIITHLGRISEGSLDPTSQTWTLNLPNSSNTIQTQRLVLCTGSSPLDPPLPYSPPNEIHHINLDDALSPTNLQSLLSPLGPTTVAVIGASHSAVLVLMNLSHIALTSKPDLRIKWFTRHPLRYAEYYDSYIARDNTGLKGEAADWAKQNLEEGRLEKSDVGKVVQKVAYQKGEEEAVYREHLSDGKTGFVVQAIGYSRNPIPELKFSNGQAIEEVKFDHDRGCFWYGKEGEKKVLPGVYGAGIAFPQRVVDKKYGHEEFNVGFFKFMKAVKGWVGGWKDGVKVEA